MHSSIGEPVVSLTTRSSSQLVAMANSVKGIPAELGAPRGTRKWSGHPQPQKLVRASVGKFVGTPWSTASPSRLWKVSTKTLVIKKLSVLPPGASGVINSGVSSSRNVRSNGIVTDASSDFLAITLMPGSTEKLESKKKKSCYKTLLRNVAHVNTFFNKLVQLNH